MKTNVTLLSRSRELFGVTIRQETKTGFLNLSDLQEAYNKAREIHGWSEKRIDHILDRQENRERLFYVLSETKSINVCFRTFMEQTEKQGIINTLKAAGVYKTTGRGRNKTTTTNPYVWALITMELNPMLYAKVVTWLTDKLIVNRIEAGNMYVGLSKAISKFNDVDYSATAKALNYIVFGRHESGIRNTGTEEQLDELHRLELNLTFAIDSGFIKSYSALLEHLRSLWLKKWDPIKKIA